MEYNVVGVGYNVVGMLYNMVQWHTMLCNVVGP